MKISDFQTKDVINIVDGRKLGQVSDLELDLRQGRIDSIVVPSYAKFFGLFGNSGSDLIIPWQNIVKIGTDVVLVRIDDTKPNRPYEEEQSTGKKRTADLYSHPAG
ncbi:PRC-barrel domain-containing protein [Paenibacillus sp. GCM10027626]|uniref:PRC-barrel domain-containing protein n=1 Tax=Paenibacillus sp. GCM10027626 TaxID=3273411 RepID=UPI00363F287A